MGCHPFHGRLYFSRWLKTPTRNDVDVRWGWVKLPAYGVKVPTQPATWGSQGLQDGGGCFWNTGTPLSFIVKNMVSCKCSPKNNPMIDIVYSLSFPLSWLLSAYWTPCGQSWSGRLVLLASCSFWQIGRFSHCNLKINQHHITYKSIGWSSLFQIIPKLI